MTQELLQELKMFGAISALEECQKKIKNRDTYINTLLESEIKRRRVNATKRLFSVANFEREHEWCELDFKINSKIDFKRFEKLFNANFLKDKINICIIGNPGTGKTHSVISLGRELCRKGFNIKFYTASKLVTELEEAKAENNLSKFMKKLDKPQLLIIDELGFVPFSDNGARLLFDVFSQRYQRGSIAVTSNLTFEKWTEIFGSIELTSALIDRFTHKAEVIDYTGTSARLQYAKKKIKSKK